MVLPHPVHVIRDGERRQKELLAARDGERQVDRQHTEVLIAVVILIAALVIAANTKTPLAQITTR